MTTFFFGAWTDDEKDEILLVEAERMRHINNPALRMSDKEHHDFMVILIDFFLFNLYSERGKVFLSFILHILRKRNECSA